jgi:hypothetical protein
MRHLKMEVNAMRLPMVEDTRAAVMITCRIAARRLPRDANAVVDDGVTVHLPTANGWGLRTVGLIDVDL